MLYALAMPSSSSPCGDGARNANCVLGKKVCAQEGPSNFDLAQFCQKKRKIERRGETDFAQFCQKTKNNKGRRTLRSRASRSDFGLAQLCHYWPGTVSYIVTSIILQFWQNHSHHFINQTMDTQFTATITDAKIFHDSLKLHNGWEKGTGQLRCIP